MAFTKQSGAVEQALVTGGLTPLAANAVMYAIGNCAQPLEHRGPFTISYVPQTVRLQTAEQRKYSYDRFDFKTSEGERRPLNPTPCDPTNPLGPCYDPPPPCELSEVCERLSRLESRVDGLDRRVTGLEYRVSTVEAFIQELAARVEAIERLLAQVQNIEVIASSGGGGSECKLYLNKKTIRAWPAVGGGGDNRDVVDLTCSDLEPRVKAIEEKLEDTVECAPATSGGGNP
jgi:hypothetical protein